MQRIWGSFYKNALWSLL